MNAQPESFVSWFSPRLRSVLAWLVISAQILALITTATLTAIQPTPQMARATIQQVGLAGTPWAWLTMSAGWFGATSQAIFGAPKHAAAAGAFDAVYSPPGFPVMGDGSVSVNPRFTVTPQPTLSGPFYLEVTLPAGFTWNSARDVPAIDSMCANPFGAPTCSIAQSGSTIRLSYTADHASFSSPFLYLAGAITAFPPTALGIYSVCGVFDTNGDTNPGNNSGCSNYIVGTPPAITSNGGGAAATINVAENSSAVTTVTASGSATINYSRSGTDAALFSINSSTGALTFLTPPNFESPVCGGDNICTITVTATGPSNLGADSQTLTINVTDVAEGSPDLTIGKSGPATATQGTNFAYTLVVTNTGAAATSGVITVTDMLPAGLSFVSGSGFICAASGQTVTCTSSAAIAVNATATINLTINPTTTGAKSNTADVIGGGDTSAASSNTVNTMVNAASSVGPGGVTTNGYLWFKADANVYADAGATAAVDGGTIQEWQNNFTNPNVTKIQQLTAAQRPTLRDGSATDAQNFNPTVDQPAGTLLASMSSTLSASQIAGSNSNLTVYAAMKQVSGGTMFAFIDAPINASNVPAVHISQDGFVLDDTCNSGTFTGIHGSGFAGNSRLLSAIWGGGVGSVNNAVYNSGVVQTLTGNDPPASVADTAQYRTVFGVACGGIYPEVTKMNEMIVYAGNHDDATRNRIESYLATKWGFTLGSTTTPVNYTASDGTTVYWTGSATYQNRVTGIGRDDNSTLNQKQSKSVNTGALVTIGLGAIATANATNANPFAADKHFDLFGDNNGATTLSTVVSGTNLNRMARIWQVQETGTVSNVVIRVPQNSFSTSNFTLLRSTDAIFDSTDTQIALTCTSGNCDATIDLANGDFFTFAQGVPNLLIGKRGPASATQGVNFTYTLVVTNTGAASTVGVVTMADSLPAGLTYVSGGGGGFTCTTAGQTVICTNNVLTPIVINGTATITLTVNSTTTGVKSNSAGVVGGGDSSAASSNTVNTTVNAAVIPPTITSSGGGANATISIPENTTVVTTVTASGTAPITYSLVGGPDAAKFTINPNSGALTFVAAPDYEAPTDSGGNNVYDLTVRASNSAGTDDQTVAVTVTNVAESAQGIEYKLLYNSATNRYEVWMRPTHTPGAPNQTVTAQVTIKAPHVAGAGAFTATNRLDYVDTQWAIGSVVRTPSEATAYDYLSFDLTFPTGNTGALAWQAGVERLVFSFQNSGVCSGPVTLMANNDPFNVFPNSAGSNPGNAIDVVVLGNDPGNDFLGDYSSGAAICPVASSVTLPLKVFLQGPYLQAAGLMTDTLRSKGLVPTTSPYTATATTTAGVLAVTGNNAIVDWVLVEVRNSATPATVVAHQSALLQRDGDVVAVDGTSTLTFTLAAGNSHVAVKHRNHLGAMTTAPVALSAATPLVDFTVSAGYGTYGQATVGSVYALWMGNTSGDNRIIGAGPTNDRNAILAEALSAPGNANHNANYIVTGYSNGDVNLDGRVIAAGPGNEINFILYNVFVHPGNGSAAANFVVQGQVP